MPRFRSERDTTRDAYGNTITTDWTYKARDNAFHEAVDKLVEDEDLAYFREIYPRRIPKRTGRLAASQWRMVKREWNRPGHRLVTQYGFTNDTRYAWILEHGGRGKKNAGNRRKGAGRIAAIWRTIRRRRNPRLQQVMERVYGD